MQHNSLLVVSHQGEERGTAAHSPLLQRFLPDSQGAGSDLSVVVSSWEASGTPGLSQSQHATITTAEVLSNVTAIGCAEPAGMGPPTVSPTE